MEGSAHWLQKISFRCDVAHAEALLALLNQREHSVIGRDEVVIVSAEEFRRLNGEHSGAALIEAMRACPYPEIDFETNSDRLPALGVDL